MIFVVFLLAFSAFSLGFLLGLGNSKQKILNKKDDIVKKISSVEEEYYNFLSYDGTEQ